MAEFFCVKNAAKLKHEYLRLQVVSLQTLAENSNNAVVIITAASVHAEETKRDLENAGIIRNVYVFS